MTHDELLAASCRMALGALLHDVGKFAERAGIDIASDALETHLQLYARRRQEASGRQWYCHRHAAYTALAIDLLEPALPHLVGTDMTPFAAWKDPDADDSLINAAALHHKPETYLQWLIATADRVASGFERETFDKYNDAAEGQGKLNHVTARQLTLFEQIRLTDDEATLSAGDALSAAALSAPQPVSGRSPRSRGRRSGQGSDPSTAPCGTASPPRSPKSPRPIASAWTSGSTISRPFG